MDRRNLRRNVARDLDRLEATFGRPRLDRSLPPLDELILTILSQNTNDLNRDRAFHALRQRFPTWGSVLEAKPDRIEAAIRSGGLARIKSRVIQDVLRRVAQEQGRLDLDVLKRMPAEEARRYLSGFRGVGDKTACCVLLFACGHAAFPVDTHIHRLAARWGLSSGRNVVETERDLKALFPEGEWIRRHLQIIYFGRRYCPARAHDFAACPICSWAASRARATREKARATKSRSAPGGAAGRRGRARR